LTHVRIGDSLFELPDTQWEDWVRSGRIPADAWVRSPVWTEGVWRLAESLEVYHLFLPTPARKARPPAPGLTDTVFTRRGLSTTEILVLFNLVVSGVLILLWRESYENRLWGFSESMRDFVGPGTGFFIVLIPMFLHASPGHLFLNMISLLASGSVTEYFYGRWKVLICYLICGFLAAGVSLVMRPKPVLSVGASGAIFGLYGLTLLFLLRHMRRFSRRQRWKTVRIYIPIMVLAVIPSIFGGDFFAHLGGFLAGCLIGAFLPPGSRIVYLTEAEDAKEPEP
jgi:rhomboid protease GluP